MTARNLTWASAAVAAAWLVSFSVSTASAGDCGSGDPVFVYPDHRAPVPRTRDKAAAPAAAPETARPAISAPADLLATYSRLDEACKVAADASQPAQRRIAAQQEVVRSYAALRLPDPYAKAQNQYVDLVLTSGAQGGLSEAALVSCADYVMQGLSETLYSPALESWKLSAETECALRLGLGLMGDQYPFFARVRGMYLAVQACESVACDALDMDRAIKVLGAVLAARPGAEVAGRAHWQLAWIYARRADGEGALAEFGAVPRSCSMYFQAQMAVGAGYLNFYRDATRAKHHFEALAQEWSSNKVWHDEAAKQAKQMERIEANTPNRGSRSGSDGK